ncbi:PQQ-dependent sugar dehydrogenase [uncultured Flavobacterium sp.]|uniref:PQQ-dependent sugar dehydrogenase n=1 Tax=uncultured Flavobacterium sp. TaxID=165435 RepID=UPI0025E2A6A3|nr:PQQ-dependent sugar dehydrogenase [uncultured Flavobacterium sp.]
MKTRLLFILTMLSSLSFAQVIDIELFASGLNSPVEIVNAGGTELYVVEQSGKIRIIAADGTVNGTDFLDLSSVLSLGGERGLLGLAFHPDYATNGFFYVNYTNTSGDTVIARYSLSLDDTEVADPDSGVILLTVDQPFSNHNGGCIRFGPDGYLYISMGDGGSGGDPQGHGQNKNSLLGKMLRIDVDGAAAYTSPADNPFVGVDGADEIWAYGLRNAWKFSFNKDNNDLWIADVGQNAIEEINKVSPTAAGLNYGWRCYEGTAEFNTTGCDEATNYTAPVAEYTHNSTGGCSITGGYVYTGVTYPALQDKYLFADYCNNKIGFVDADNNITFSDAFSGQFFTTFGEDINGELYIAGSATGNVYRIIDSALSTQQNTNKTFSIYPNPADDVVTIQSGNGVIPTAVVVYDMSGKVLLTKAFNNVDDTTIITDALPSGLYLLDVTGNDGAHYNYKLSIK